MLWAYSRELFRRKGSLTFLTRKNSVYERYVSEMAAHNRFAIQTLYSSVGETEFRAKRWLNRRELSRGAVTMQLTLLV